MMTLPAEYDFLKKLTHLPVVEKIILFGSRARKDHQARSDIDLAISCPEAGNKDWLQILEIIENADTLLKIDCVQLDALDVESDLSKNILREEKLIYGKVHD